jgi:hypothetical protein
VPMFEILTFSCSVQVNSFDNFSTQLSNNTSWPPTMAVVDMLFMSIPAIQDQPGKCFEVYRSHYYPYLLFTSQSHRRSVSRTTSTPTAVPADHPCPFHKNPQVSNSGRCLAYPHSSSPIQRVILGPRRQPVRF